MAISNKPWGSISASDYADANAYCRACLIDLNEAGSEKTKSKCKLPVHEPGGALNRNGVHAAAGRLAGAGGGVNAPAEAKRKAARALIRLYGRIGDEPPESLRRIANA